MKALLSEKSRQARGGSGASAIKIADEIPAAIPVRVVLLSSVAACLLLALAGCASDQPATTTTTMTTDRYDSSDPKDMRTRSETTTISHPAYDFAPTNTATDYSSSSSAIHSNGNMNNGNL